MRRNIAEFSSETKVRNLFFEIREFRRSSLSFLLHSTAALKKIKVKNSDGAHCQISQVCRVCYIEHFPVYQKRERLKLCDTHKFNFKHLRRNPSGN